MKFFLISDDKDTVTGLRLAGIEGKLATDETTAVQAIDEALQDKEIGIILITNTISELCADKVSDIKLNVVSPLLVEIPDSKSTDAPNNNIMNYVNNAIGVKM